MREMFRGLVVKSLVAFPLERLNFRVHNTIIVHEAVEFYGECWRERCNALHTPEYEKISLNNEIKQIKKYAAKGDKVNYEDMLICILLIKMKRQLMRCHHG